MKLPILFGLLIGLYCGASSSLFADSSVQLSKQEQSALQAFGPWPLLTPADPGNEFSGLAWAEHLGQTLFNDKQLFGDASIACSSCHQADSGFTDTRPLAFGKHQHIRNTQSLLNVGLQRWFGWDGGADSLWAASLRPMLSDVEMGASIGTTADQVRTRKELVAKLQSQGIQVTALDDEELIVTIAKLIGAYQRTLVSGITAFDQYRLAVQENNQNEQRQYSNSAKRGLKLFLGSANCHMCHFGPNFSNGEFHDIGRPFFTDVGQVDAGRYAGIKRVKTDPYNLNSAFSSATATERRKLTTVTLGQVNYGQWRTPSLRNLRQSAPYMHDGSLATLRDVVDFYADIDTTRLHSNGESILNPQSWSDDDRNDLVNFLLSLSLND